MNFDYSLTSDSLEWRTRFINSDYTKGTWSPRQLENLFGKGIYIYKGGKAAKDTADKNVTVIAEELHHPNNDWSGVYFSNGYIQRDFSHDGSARPEFDPNAHFFVPNIGAGHSARNSILKSPI